MAGAPHTAVVPPLPEARDASEARSRRRLAAGLIVFFATFAAAFAAIVPPLEAPDEPDHLAYVNFVATHAALPNQYDERQRVFGQGHQAPLWYVLAAVPVRLLEPDRRINVSAPPNPDHLWRGGHTLAVPFYRHGPDSPFAAVSDAVAFYGLRAMSVLCGVANLLVLLALGRRWLGSGPVALLVPLFAATLPQFAFLSGVVSPDNLTSLLCTVAVWYAMRALSGGTREACLFGVALGLAVLSKKTALFLIPATAVLFAVEAVRHRDRATVLLGHFALAFGVATVLSGGLFVRSWVLYRDLLGTTMEKATLPMLVAEKSLASDWFRGPFWSGLGRSFVGLFGWLNVPLPAAACRLWIALATAALAGVVLGLRARRVAWHDVLIALLFVGGCLAGTVYYNLSFSQAQGRYLFPVLAFLGFLWAAGWRALLAHAPSRLRPVLAAGLVVALGAVDAAAVWAVWRFFRA